MKQFVCGLKISFALIIGCFSGRASAANGHSLIVSTGSVASIVRAITEIPPWNNPASKPDQIIKQCVAFQNVDTLILRDSILRFMENCRADNSYGTANMARLFVLNRVLFDVPEKETTGVAFFGGWDGIPYTNGVANLLWPISRGPRDELLLTGKFQGYSGHPFWAIHEFDYFNKKYGRRK